MNTKILFAVSVLGMSVLTDVQAGQTLYTPVEGSFIKNPSALTFQSLGLQTSSVSTISLSGASYSQYMGWFKYQKNLYTMGGFNYEVQPKIDFKGSISRL